MSKKYLVIIKGDMNDADYKSVTHEVGEEEVELFRKVGKAINGWQKKNPHNRHNWDSTEYRRDGKPDPYEAYKDVLTVEEIDMFSDYVPSGGDYPVYMIEDLIIYTFTSKEEII